MGQEFKDLLQKYDCKSQPTTIKNPQANALVERMYLLFANQLRAKIFEEDTWVEDTDYLVEVCAWALRTTVPSNVPNAPGTFAFSMDMIYRQSIMVD